MSELVGPLGYEEEQYKKNYSDATQNVKYFDFHHACLFTHSNQYYFCFKKE